MIHRYGSLILLAALLLKPSLALAAASDSILLSLEEPSVAGVYTGIANIRGWAVAPVPIERAELYLEGRFISTLPIGGSRADVAAAFPGFPNAGESGFSMAFNYSELSPGTHTLTVRVITVGGDFNEATTTFETTRFHKPFIENPAAVSLAAAQISHDGTALYLDNLWVEEAAYNVTLRWDTAAQRFAIKQITPLDTTLSHPHSHSLSELQSQRPLQRISQDTETPSAVPALPGAMRERPALHQTQAFGININMYGQLEEPIAGKVYTGVSNIRGWAVALTTVNRVELYLDDTFVAVIPMGGSRPDVAAALPTWPNAAQSGFSMAFNYSELSPGTHTIRVRLIEALYHGVREESASFTTTRFHKPFLGDPSAVSLATAEVSHDGTAIQLDNVAIEDKSYDMILKWETSVQGFMIERITDSGFIHTADSDSRE
jgi:N-acetylmuramoyl-L-alanine amidase